MADFSFNVHRITPEAPVFNVVKTQMEGTRVKRRLKSTESQRRWSVEIRGRTTSEKNAILSHYNGQQGGTTPFYWNVPAPWGGDTFYVTYDDFSYENPDGLYNVWEIYIVFLEEIV